MTYKIKEYREAKSMSQAELSEKSNVSRAIISGLETGAAQTTTTETLRKIADALGVKVSDIFFD